MDSQDIEEIRVELKRLTDLTKANYSMLRSIERRAHIGMFVSILKWAIVVGAAVGIYYYVQPLVDQFGQVYQTVTGSKLDVIKFFKSF